MSSKKELYLGDNLINSSDTEISGKEVVINNENFLTNYFVKKFSFSFAFNRKY